MSCECEIHCLAQPTAAQEVQTSQNCKNGTMHCKRRRGPGGKLIQSLSDPPPNHLIIDPAQLAAINCSLQYTHTVCSLASYLLSSVCVCDCVCVFVCIYVFIRGVLKGGGWQWIREDIGVWQPPSLLFAHRGVLYNWLQWLKVFFVCCFFRSRLHWFLLLWHLYVMIFHLNNDQAIAVENWKLLSTFSQSKISSLVPW